MLKLVIGLGNIGKQYSATVHNMGFMVVDGVAEKLGVKFKKKECDAEIAEAFVGGEKVILAKPTTYMNLSGIAAKGLMKKYKISIDEIVVVSDDIDLEPSKIRIREQGSAGTHNGLKSIIAEIGGNNFKRVRIGVGKAPEFMDLADYVLSKVKMTEAQKLGIDKGINSVYDLVMGESVSAVMQKYN